MTPLTKPVSRVTSKRFQGRPVIVTLAPAGSQDEALIGFRLQGTRMEYILSLSDVYRMAALMHGQKEARAKREARLAGIPWRTARRAFIASNSIP